MDSRDELRSAAAEAAQLLDAGNDPAAERVCREILARSPDFVPALRLLASMSLRYARADEAVELLRTAIVSDPNNLSLRYELGLALTENREFEAARGAFAAAEGTGIPRPADYVLHGDSLLKMRDYRAAVEKYEKAISADASNRTGLLRLGQVLKIVGSTERAIACYRRCLELYPDAGEAYWGLANFKTVVFGDDDIASMRNVAEQGNLRPQSAARLFFALGHALDQRGNYAEAFEWLNRGNAICYRNDPVDIGVIRNQSSRITRVFDSDLVGRLHADEGGEAPIPIFIVGMPRSGSTLVEQILASHSEVEATEELAEFGMLLDSIGNRSNPETLYPEGVLAMDRDAVLAIGARYLEMTGRYRSGSRYFIDKMPNNFRDIGLIATALPQAVIVRTYRHPMDTCLSCYRQMFFRGQGFTNELRVLGQYYLIYERIMEHWRRALPGRIVEVEYEALVADPATQIRRLVESCGLTWQPQCLDFYKTSRAINTASSEQVRRPVYDTSIGRWRHYEAQLAPLAAILRPLL